MQVLVVSASDRSLPDGATDLLGEIGWTYATARSFREAIDATQAGGVDAAIVYAPESPPGSADTAEFQTFVRLLDARRMPAVVMGGAAAPHGDGHSLVDVVRRDIPLPELRGRLAMIERYHGPLQRLEQELHNMERLSNRLNEHFHEIDQEMRLAGRLQRDFLPDLTQPIGNLRFAGVYRPATWVSGDIFDVFPVDEDHVAIYIADAVGHGMAASLLTMFIKRAIVPKTTHPDGHTYLRHSGHGIPLAGGWADVTRCPSQVLAALNDALVDQALPNCQFVTACYALLHTKTLKLQFARAGHPYPLRITPDRTLSELKAPGGLLGLFKGETYPLHETNLQPGDKIILHTDGVELAFRDPDAALNTNAYHPFFQSVAHLPVEEMMNAVDHRLDREAGSLNPQDDVTILGFEVLPPA